MTNFQKNGVDINSLIFKDDANGTTRQNINVGTINTNNNDIDAGTGDITCGKITASDDISVASGKKFSGNLTGTATGLSGSPAISVGALTCSTITATGNITATNQTITADTFNGSLTGNVTGSCTGSSGSCTGNAKTATTAGFVGYKSIVPGTGGNTTVTITITTGYYYIIGYRCDNAEGNIIMGDKDYDARKYLYIEPFGSSNPVVINERLFTGDGTGADLIISGKTISYTADTGPGTNYYVAIKAFKFF